MTILYVDDDFDDRAFVAEAFREIDPAISCLTACDGVQALRTLNNAVQLPDFIFLDINMPVMNGKECLEKLKNDERFRTIPVVMYSTTTDPSEIDFYYKLGAMSFVKKPHSFTQLCSALSNFLQSVQR
jgi:CheY-like chemotaxis protein